MKLQQLSLEHDFMNLVQEEYDIENAEFLGGEAFEADLYGLGIKNCVFSSCHFTDCNFDHATISDTNFVCCELSSATFRDTGLKNVTFTNCKLMGTVFVEASLQGCTFFGCSASYANFARALLRGCQLVENTLRQSVFSSTRFQKCFLQSDFTGTDFMHAVLHDVDLTACLIDGALFDPLELRGLQVTREQAASIAAILGLIIK